MATKAPPSSGIPEAPSDGRIYGRQNAAWVVVPAGIPGPPGPQGPPGPMGPPGPAGGGGTEPIPDTAGWHQLPIGAGGFVTKIDIAADGTKVVGTDTYGGYVWNASTSRWDQLVTITSMPASPYGGIDHEEGIYDVRICPSNTNKFYMATLGVVYVSTNRGALWTRCPGFTQLSHTEGSGESMFPNDHSVITYPKLHGPRIAIDPANANHVILGTGADGMFRTIDGGTTWTAIASVPIGSDRRGCIVCFDPSSTVSGGITQGVYASSFGNGVYHSTNGGAAFGAMAGSPTTHNNIVCASNGVVFITPDGGAGNVNMHRFSGGTWTTTSIGVANGRNTHAVAVDPGNVSRIVAVCSSGELSVSIDGGTSYAGLPAIPNGNLRVSPTIPWLAATNEHFMATGNVAFDPTASNKLYQAGGIGVWYTNPNNTSTTVATFTADTVGIEQLVANAVVMPAGGTPVVAAWDRPLFKSPSYTTFPANHGFDYSENIQMGWDVTSAVSDPSYIAAVVNWGTEKSCYSTDGGLTWTKFINFPDTVGTGKIGGSIAASTPSNLVYVQQNNGALYYTGNGGSTWSAPTFAGVPTTGETGWGFSYAGTRKSVCADRVTVNKFYAYNYLTGIWVSTNSGATWTLQPGTQPPGGALFGGTNDTLKAVPGNAGHLFYSAGRVTPDNPAATPFVRSTNGGAAWTVVPNFLEVYQFCLGAVAPGQTYPSIYAIGWNSGTFGMWRSYDNAATWTNFGDFPNGNYDGMTCMAADPDVLGRVIVGFRGSGWAYYADA